MTIIETIQQQLPNKTRKFNAEAIIDFYSISARTGYLPSYRTMQKIFGKHHEVIQQLLIDNKIISISKDAYFTMTDRLGVKSISKIKRRIKYELNTDDIDESTNVYYQKFLDLKNNNLILNKKDLMIINHIEDTISRSTIDGKPLPFNFLKKKKNRIYSNYSCLPKETRTNIHIDNKPTVSLDLTSASLQILSQTNFGYGLDHKLYFDFINSDDFYTDQANKLGLTRDEVKILWNKSIFGEWFSTDKRLIEQYPEFFNILRRYKRKNGYSQLSSLYFKLEYDIMSEIMSISALNKKDYLPLHDCLIVKEEDVSYISKLFIEKKLKFKIN